MPDLRVFVTTSNSYLPALRPFSYLFNKYWGSDAQVVVVGFDAPQFDLPDNFTFYSIGNQDDYPVSKWSDALIKFLNDVPDEVFCLLLEDYWLIRPVNREAVKMLYDYMGQFRYVIKTDLCADRLYAHGSKDYGHCGYLDLIISMPGSPYHMSLWPGLWSKEHLLRTLIPNETPWDIELIGTTRLSHDQSVIVIGTHNYPVRITSALRGGEHSKLLLSELEDGDVRELRKLGFLEHWESE